MSIPKQSKWKTRLIEREFPNRSFDIEFWQEQGDEAIFAAAWELLEPAEEVSHGRKPTRHRTLQLLNEFEVEYLMVGGFAVMKYGEPRYTKRSRRGGCQYRAEFRADGRSAEEIWRCSRA
jgi:hypothetical protein